MKWSSSPKQKTRENCQQEPVDSKYRKPKADNCTFMRNETQKHGIAREKEKQVQKMNINLLLLRKCIKIFCTSPLCGGLLSIHATLMRGGWRGCYKWTGKTQNKTKEVQLFWESKLNQGPCPVAAVEPDTHAFHQRSGREENSEGSCTNWTEALDGFSTFSSLLSLLIKKQQQKVHVCKQMNVSLVTFPSMYSPTAHLSLPVCIDTESLSLQNKPCGVCLYVTFLSPK